MFSWFKILVVNKMACELFGLTSEELTGMKMTNLLSIKDREMPDVLQEHHLDTSGRVVIVSGKVVSWTPPTMRLSHWWNVFYSHYLRIIIGSVKSQTLVLVRHQWACDSSALDTRLHLNLYHLSRVKYIWPGLDLKIERAPRQLSKI